MAEHPLITIERIAKDKLDLFLSARDALMLGYPDDDKAREFIATDNLEMVVALDGLVVVAAVVAYIIPNIYNTHPKMLIDVIAAHIDYRGKDVLCRLLTQLKVAAKERNVRDMECFVDARDEHTIQECVEAGGFENNHPRIRFLWNASDK